MTTQTGMLVGVLALPASMVLMLVAMLAGRRLRPTKAVKFLVPFLTIIAASGALSFGYLMREDMRMFPLAMWSVMPMCVGMGLGFGMADQRLSESRKYSAAASLAAWKRQLDMDKAASAGPAVLAADLVKIGDICRKELGENAEALAAYEQVYAIYSKELPRHPLQFDYLSNYYKLLLKVGDKKRAEELGDYWKLVGASWRRLRGDEE